MISAMQDAEYVSRRIFFFNDTATTEIYTLSLHDALPISRLSATRGGRRCSPCARAGGPGTWRWSWPPAVGRRSWRARDRKSTRLNSSHANISYAVFCLKKKNNCYVIDFSSLTIAFNLSSG